MYRLFSSQPVSSGRIREGSSHFLKQTTIQHRYLILRVSMTDVAIVEVALYGRQEDEEGCSIGREWI